VSQTSAGASRRPACRFLGSDTVRLDTAVKTRVTTLGRNHTGSISSRDDDSLGRRTVTDTAAAGSVATTGIASGGFDVKLTTTQPLARCRRGCRDAGGGDLTLNINGDVSQTSAGSITAPACRFWAAARVRLDSATKQGDDAGRQSHGSISYTDDEQPDGGDRGRIRLRPAASHGRGSQRAVRRQADDDQPLSPLSVAAPVTRAGAT